MLVRKTCILFLFAALLGAGSLRAQQFSVEPKISRITANDVHWLESAVANPVVVTSDTNWKSA